jgi:hypothetical protein
MILVSFGLQVKENSDIPDEDNLITLNISSNIRMPFGSTLMLQGFTGSGTSGSTLPVLVQPICTCPVLWSQV